MFNSDELACFIFGLVVGILGGIMIGLIIGNANDKFCPECGARYGVTAEYCTNDGSELREVKN